MSPSSWQGRPVLVTGGCGFVGAHLVRRLVAAGAVVRVADDLSKGDRSRLADLGDGVELRVVDLTDQAAAVAVCEGAEVVFDLAAQASGITDAAPDHAAILAVNARLVMNVLEGVRRAGARRYVYMSSSCIYGSDAPIPYVEDAPGTGPPEGAHLGYGWGKRMGEVQAGLTRLQGVATTCLRAVNVAGPGDYYTLDGGHVIPSLIMKALASDDGLEVMGSGRQTRSFVDVGDLADILMRVAADGEHLEIVNVSTPDEVSIGQLAQLVLDATGRGHLPLRFDLDRPEGAPRKVANLDRLLAFLGDYAFTPLAESVARAVDEYGRQESGS